MCFFCAKEGLPISGENEAKAFLIMNYMNHVVRDIVAISQISQCFLVFVVFMCKEVPSSLFIFLMCHYSDSLA